MDMGEKWRNCVSLCENVRRIFFSNKTKTHAHKFVRQKKTHSVWIRIVGTGIEYSTSIKQIKMTQRDNDNNNKKIACGKNCANKREYSTLGIRTLRKLRKMGMERLILFSVWWNGEIKIQRQSECARKRESEWYKYR